MRRFSPSLVIGLILPLGLITSARADASTCQTETDGWVVNSGCPHPGAQTIQYVTEHADHSFRVELACSTGNSRCPVPPPTCGPPGDGGEVYAIWEDEVLLPWQACLSQDQAKQINGLTPGFVERAFKRLTWPASGLVVQPPHGRTLVDFDTNFYTANTAPTTQTITLLGQRLRIEATPSEYTWHFGAGEPDQTTADPGAPYPDLRVTHRYLTVGTVTPSVDTTYTGRYRVNGGDWQTIPDTLTVPGPVVTLQVLSATPHLVWR